MNVKKLAKELEDQLKKNSRKNKDSGKLEKSIKVTETSNGLVISMLEYGLYQKTDFIDKSIDEVLTENNIIDAIFEDIDFESNNREL